MLRAVGAVVTLGRTLVALRETKSPPINWNTAGLSTESKRNDSALAGSLGHAGSPFGLAAGHFVGRDIFHVRGHAPGMAEGIVEFTVAVAPEHIGHWHGRFG